MNVIISKIMRIAVFHNLPAGGAKRVALEQAKLLSKKHKIDIYEINRKKDVFNFENDKFRVFSYAFKIGKSGGVFKRLKRDYQNFITLDRLHKRIATEIDTKNYDCVIVHHDRYTQSPFILKHLKTPNIYYCHELLRIVYEDQFGIPDDIPSVNKIYEKITRLIRKKIDFKNANSAQKIVSSSDHIGRKIKDVYKKSVFIVNPGVSVSVFKPISLKKTNDVLFIGEKNQFDGYDLLEDALSMIGFQIKVKVFDKNERGKWISDKFLAREYNSARVIVTLSRNEPFGLIPLEAASCGIPVVAINEGGYKETLIEGKTGFLVRPNGQKIAEKISLLLKNNRLSNQISITARKNIVNNWDWKVKIQDLEHVLLKISSGNTKK